MRETLRDIMRGVAFNQGTRPRKIANNTASYISPEGATVYRLHHTDVVTAHRNGTVTLNSGGWRTPTTKDRINAYSGARIYASGGQWFIASGGVDVPFVDGMSLNADGTIQKKYIKAGELEAARRDKLSKAVNAT